MSSKSGIIRAATVDDMQPWTAVPSGYDPRFKEFYWSIMRGLDSQGRTIVIRGALKLQPDGYAATIRGRIGDSVVNRVVPWVNPTFVGDVFNVNDFPLGDPSLMLDVGDPDLVVYRWRIGQSVIEYGLRSEGAPLWYSDRRNEEADLMHWSPATDIGGFDEPRPVSGRIVTDVGETSFEGFGLFEHAVSVEKPKIKDSWRNSRWMWFGDQNFYGLVLESRDRSGTPLVKTGRFGRRGVSALRLDDFTLDVPMAVEATRYHLVEGVLWNPAGDAVGKVGFNMIEDALVMYRSGTTEQAAALMRGNVGEATFNGVAGTERQLKPSPTNLALILLGGAVVVSLLASY